MSAYRRVYDSRHLQAKNRDQNHTLGNGLPCLLACRPVSAMRRSSCRSAGGAAARARRRAPAAGRGAPVDAAARHATARHRPGRSAPLPLPALSAARRCAGRDAGLRRRQHRAAGRPRARRARPASARHPARQRRVRLPQGHRLLRPGYARTHACPASIRYFISEETVRTGWWRGTVVERRSLAGELSLSCA